MVIFLIFLEYIIFAIFVYILFRKEKRSYAFSHPEYCKSCREVVDSDNLNCSNCKEQIKKVCDECGSLIDTEWRYCPFCDRTKK